MIWNQCKEIIHNQVLLRY